MNREHLGRELTVADENTHTQQGQIERAQRLRKVIEGLKEGRPSEAPDGSGKSLKEQIDERAAESEKPSGTP